MIVVGTIAGFILFLGIAAFIYNNYIKKDNDDLFHTMPFKSSKPAVPSKPMVPTTTTPQYTSYATVPPPTNLGLEHDYYNYNAQPLYDPQTQNIYDPQTQNVYDPDTYDAHSQAVYDSQAMYEPSQVGYDINGDVNQQQYGGYANQYQYEQNSSDMYAPSTTDPRYSNDMPK